MVFFAGALVTIGWLISGNPPVILLVLVTLFLCAFHKLVENPAAAFDVWGFLPYGVLYSASPGLFGFCIDLTVNSKASMIFLQAFGYQNIVGIATQSVFPSAAPWYNGLYGYAPASYNMPGNPTSEVRVDKLFVTHLYTSRRQWTFRTIQ
ncbi:Aureobasidin resistance protein Aur1 [Rhizophlyctis rosea]|nr:Aureobasidin resistance protein Aur1 [Rhizophlyctis rosea]